MLSRDQFARLSTDKKLLYLYDELAMTRAAAASTGAVIEDLRARLARHEEAARKRPDDAS